MRWIPVAAALLVCGCTKEPVAAAPAKPPPTLDQLLERELPDSVGDELVELGTRRLKVEAAGPVKVEVDPAKKFVELKLPLGTQLPVQCFVYPTAIDAGATITRAIAQVKSRFTIA